MIAVRSASLGGRPGSSMAPMMISACHCASLAVVWPSALVIRMIVWSFSNPPSIIARTRLSAATSASVKATASSGRVANPRARQIRSARSCETPASWAT